MDKSRRASSCAFGALLALTLGACGGGNSGPSAPSTPTPPPPVPCTQSVLVQDSGTVPRLTIVYDDFSVPDSGRLDITVDWTNAPSPMGLYVVPANTCSTVGEFNARTCNFLGRSEPPGAKPRKISVQVAAGNYRWMVANGGQDDESSSLQIVLSKGSCAPFGASAPSVSSHRGELPSIVRSFRW